MADWRNYYNQFRGVLPPIQSIYGDIAKSTAGTYGAAANQAGRAFTGSGTSGAYGGQMGDIWTQRGSKLADVMAKLKTQERQDMIRLLGLAVNKAEADKAGRLGGLQGIGKAAGFGLSMIPGLGTAGQVAGGGLSILSGGQPFGGEGDIDAILEHYRNKYPEIFQYLEQNNQVSM